MRRMGIKRLKRRGDSHRVDVRISALFDPLPDILPHLTLSRRSDDP